jgi:hypothetical protein
MIPSSKLPSEFARMLAAYKLQLSRRAKELGSNLIGTWGQTAISPEMEERLTEGEGYFRLAPFPYPGLRSFDPKEGRLFFGRDRSVSEVQKRLADHGIATVLGGSGSGKSSLVRAGLLPYLNNKRRIPGRAGSWYIAEFRPRVNPLRELADALADQVMLPLLEIDAPGLAEAMNLTKGAPPEVLKQKLRDKMRARFQEAQEKGGNAVRDSLLRFVDCELDEFDKLASQGVRVPGASLMLLLDQFEEVFRSEIVASQRKTLLDLVVGLDASIGRRNERNELAYKGGLFLTITMRSEELHRCAEHRGLSEVVNRSFYLLDLLDPDNQDDAKELRKAIVRPARDVFEDWGLAYDRNQPDAPFANGMPAWLLSGAGRRLPHQPDQLPLLQHALQATWHAAMRRWSDAGFADKKFEIRREDLPGQGRPVSAIPDLGKCLCVRADKAAERAKERFAAKAETSKEEGEKVLRAAFRSLAHRDDRGNWTRRFASIDDIQNFLVADQNFVPTKASDEAVQGALSEFLIRGYLSGGRGSPYDISHEALIRNWPRFQDWLSGPESAARALERVVQEIGPGSKERGRQQLLDRIPAAVSEQLLPILGPEPTLPRSWALQRLEFMLERPALRERWESMAPNSNNKELAKAVLEEIDGDRRYVDEERRKQVRWKLAKKFAPALVFAGLAVLVVLWFTLQQSMSALYAAHAETLLGAAVSEHGAQLLPDRRARVTLRSLAYIETAARLGGNDFVSRWVHDSILPSIFHVIGAYLPTMTNKELQQRADRAFDFTAREVLGRRFAIVRDLQVQSIGSQSRNCLAVRKTPDWIELQPEQDTDEKGWKRAFRIQEEEAQGERQGALRLEFGAAGETGGIQLASSDLQISLPTGAWLCVSPDATVLTSSSPSKRFPDLYELQWTRCAPQSQCKQRDRDWRVRYVPIPLAPSEALPPDGVPCVMSINPLPNGPQAAKFQVIWAYKEADCSHDRPSGLRSAEFYAALSVPRTVQVPSIMTDLLTPCKETSEENRARAIYTCEPRQVIEWNIGDATAKFGQKINTIIEIEERGRDEPDTVDVFVKDDSSKVKARVSLPAQRIDRAGVTESGDILLQDEGANMTWRFVEKRSRLERLLRQRGCGAPNGIDTRVHDVGQSDHMRDSEDVRELEDLAELDIDSACTSVSK